MLEVLIDVKTAAGATVTHSGPLFETKDEALAWVGRLWRGTPHTVRIVRLA